MAELTKRSTKSVLTTAAAGSAAASDTEAEALKTREEAVLKELPSYMVKLVGDYRGQYYYFETIECMRKLLLICIPVFFDPQVKSSRWP